MTTTAECRDKLAEYKGWHFSVDREQGPIGWVDPEGKLTSVTHPIEDSLQGAADSLPEGWRLAVTQMKSGKWYAVAVLDSPDMTAEANKSGHATELEARFALALAAWQAGEKGRGQC